MAHRHRAGGSLDQRVEALRANRISGAVDLALDALELAADWLGSGRPVAALAAELRNMHPAIATIAGVARLLEEPASDLSSLLAATRVSLTDGNRLIARTLQAVIAPASQIITLSNSSTVREALFALEPARVYVMHSLPGGEGESQAAALRTGLADRGGGVRVELVPDSALANLVPLVDCALVGIDSYDGYGAILHKVGTLPLALCCRHFGKPFYAAGHSLKFVAGDVQGFLERDGEPAEQMFDCTPGALISRIVTERDEA
jgi:translation initiation factor 2B subunit (eIF-2B alpha/beta/delta family)